MNYTIISIVFVFFCLFSWSCFSLSAHSDFVYKGLDEIWDRVKKTDDTEELKKIHNELIEFYKKYCFHRKHGDYARRVEAYIRGKYAALDKK